VVLSCGQKSCFFSFAPSEYFSQSKSSKINFGNTTRHGLLELPSHDQLKLSVRRILGGKNPFLFQLRHGFFDINFYLIKKMESRSQFSLDNQTIIEDV
jgi:hypothetical protein